MFWMRNKENSFPIHTLKIIWRPASRPDELVIIAAHDQTCHQHHLCCVTCYRSSEQLSSELSELSLSEF